MSPDTIPAHLNRRWIWIGKFRVAKAIADLIKTPSNSVAFGFSVPGRCTQYSGPVGEQTHPLPVAEEMDSKGNEKDNQENQADIRRRNMKAKKNYKQTSKYRTLKFNRQRTNVNMGAAMVFMFIMIATAIAGLVYVIIISRPETVIVRGCPPGFVDEDSICYRDDFIGSMYWEGSTSYDTESGVVASQGIAFRIWSPNTVAATMQIRHNPQDPLSETQDRHPMQ